LLSDYSRKKQNHLPRHLLDLRISVDANGTWLSICTAGKATFGPFNQLCFSVADSNTNTSDPTLLLHVPSNASGPLTLYAHMIDYRGNARPDFIFPITISGAN
jgi:hypothetical protein